MNKYGSYAELARNEILGTDYRMHSCERARSPLLIVAPHGGMIEIGTSEIARLIAGDEYSLFIFEGLKPYGANRDLHITSHEFDHPDCLSMAARCKAVLSVHGCTGESRIHVGGLDEELVAQLAAQLRLAGFIAEAGSSKYPGRHPLNICNRGSSAKGAQLEIPYDLRAGEAGTAIAFAARSAIAERRLGSALAHDDQPTKYAG